MTRQENESKLHYILLYSSFCSSRKTPVLVLTIVVVRIWLIKRERVHTFSMYLSNTVTTCFYTLCWLLPLELPSSGSISNSDNTSFSLPGSSPSAIHKLLQLSLSWASKRRFLRQMEFEVWNCWSQIISDV